LAQAFSGCSTFTPCGGCRNLASSCIEGTVRSFQMPFTFLILFALSAFAAADSGCAENNGENCPAGDETAFVQYSGEVSKAKESRTLQALMDHEAELEETIPPMGQALAGLIKVFAAGMVNPSNCESVADMTKQLLFSLDVGLTTVSDQLDAYSTDTLQAQRVYLEKLHNTSGTVGEYMQKFGELVNASLDADGHGKHVFGKILMPLVMKGMSGLDKAGYADIAELLNDTMFEDGVSWVLKKSSGTVAKVKTVAGAETALLIKDVNTTLEATLSRFTSLSEAVSLSLDGLTGGISSMLLGRFPKECAHLITDPIKMVNNTKDNMIQSMDTFIDKMVGNVRDGMNTVVGVVGAAA